MLKRLIVFVFLLLIAFPACATIYLVNPVEASLKDNDSINLGSIARGETLELIVKRKSDREFEWSTISVAGSSPKNWQIEKTIGPKTLILGIKIPADAIESTQNIAISVSSEEQPLTTEKFNALVAVKKNLLSVDIKNLNQSTVVDEPVYYTLTIINDSIAEHSVIIHSSLPSYWFPPQKITIAPKRTKEITMQLQPKAYGKREFLFTVDSLLNDSKFDFSALLSIYPTLESKYSVALYGFPFFTLSLLPYYLINSFLALLS